MLHRTHSHAPNIYNPSYSLPIAFIHSFIHSFVASLLPLSPSLCMPPSPKDSASAPSSRRVAPATSNAKSSIVPLVVVVLVVLAVVVSALLFVRSRLYNSSLAVPTVRCAETRYSSMHSEGC